MNINLETEYKTLVSEEEFYRLLSLFKTDEPIIQTNYYYDTEDSLLYKNKMALRIREINHKYECTIKKSINNNQKEEINFYCHSIDPTQIDELKNYLNFFDLSSLNQIGILKTERRIHNDGIGELCFDKSYYNNVLDYEVEYEQINECDNFFERFTQILKKADIKYQPAVSKLKRCLASHINN